MHVHFVLVEPARTTNVGAAARALKTMGFTSLRIVGNKDYVDDDSRKLAYGSHDVLTNAAVFASLSEAIKDLDFVIGTTARKRTGYYDYHTPEQAADRVAAKDIDHLGIVFGREDRGLEGDEIALCDMLSHMVLAQPYPSINLSQSVMIYAYIFSRLEPAQTEEDAPEEKEQGVLRKRAEAILRELDIDKKLNLHRRIIERIMQANKDDTHLMLSFHRYVKQKLDELR